MNWGGVHELGLGNEDKTRSSRTKSGKTGKEGCLAVTETLATLPGARASLSAQRNPFLITFTVPTFEMG